MMMNWDFSQGCLMTLILVGNMLIIDHDRGWGAQAKCWHGGHNSLSNRRKLSIEHVTIFSKTEVDLKPGRMKPELKPGLNLGG